MFVQDRKALIETLTKMQRHACCYDMFRYKEDATPARFCDCKYGMNGEERGEQTGCPELRCIVLLLQSMTDNQFAKIMHKGHGIIL